MSKILDFNKHRPAEDDNLEIEYIDDIMIFLKKKPEKKYDTAIHQFPIKKQCPPVPEKSQP